MTKHAKMQFCLIFLPSFGATSGEAPRADWPSACRWLRPTASCSSLPAFADPRPGLRLPASAAGLPHSHRTSMRAREGERLWRQGSYLLNWCWRAHCRWGWAGRAPVRSNAAKKSPLPVGPQRVRAPLIPSHPPHPLEHATRAAG